MYTWHWGTSAAVDGKASEDRLFEKQVRREDNWVVGRSLGLQGIGGPSEKQGSFGMSITQLLPGLLNFSWSDRISVLGVLTTSPSM